MTKDDQGKYLVPSDEQGGNILPNKRGFDSKTEIDKAEFIGFLKAQNHLIDQLDEKSNLTLIIFSPFTKWSLMTYMTLPEN